MSPVFFKKMIMADPRFMILPWKENSEEKPIIKNYQILKILYGLKNFFHRTSPRPQGGILYINIWTITNMTHQDLTEKILWWLNHKRMTLPEAAI